MTTNCCSKNKQVLEKSDIVSCQQIFSDEIEELLKQHDSKPPIQTFACARVRDHKKISEIYKYLSQEFPLEVKFKHLKRISHTNENDEKFAEMLLCPLEVTTSSAKLFEYLPMGLIKLLKHFDLEIVFRSVPKTAPLTRQQRQTWNIKFWPTQPNCVANDKEYTLYGKLERLSKLERERLLHWMNRAMHLAKLAKREGHRYVGTVLVEPMRNFHVAESGDCSRGKSPLAHSCMNCIKQVGKLICEAKLYFEGTREKGKRMNFKVPKKYEFYTPQSYLCTGLDVYTTKEPCTMCSMALVHSRVRRVFFMDFSPDGGLCTKRKLFCNKSLNHSFEVFHVILE